MKTILAATDYSKVSLNAVEYAANFAIFTNSKLILFHVYTGDAIDTEAPYEIASLAELKADGMNRLSKIQEGLLAKHGHKLDIECKCKPGNAVDMINDFAKNNNIDLIVMGMQGVGYIAQQLIGSSTTALLRKSHCPVLSIYQDLVFKPVKKIVLACDYVDLDANAVLEPLKKIVTIFNAEVYLLHITEQFELESKLSEKDKVSKTLGDMRHSFHSIQSGDVVKGINAFVASHKMDMVVMVPRKHSIIDNILYEPDSKKMAFHSKVPLLALPELL